MDTLFVKKIVLAFYDSSAYDMTGNRERERWSDT